MKSFIIATLLLTSGLSLAQECKKPTKPKVKKKPKPTCKPEVIIQKEYVEPDYTAISRVISYHVAQAQRKNHLSLYLGRGPDNLNFNHVGSTYNFSQNYGLVSGVSYSRSLNPDYNIGLLGLTNGTLLASMGVDF